MTGRRIGIVIGNNYPNSNKELKFAVADAIKMKEILENKEICGFDEVIDLQDGTSKDASIVIEKILRKMNNDIVFIYYSGHGKKDFEGNLCLLFNDTEEDTLLTSSLTFDFISKCMRYPSRKSVIIVLDCCYSGVAGIRDSEGDVMEALKKHTGSGITILTSTGSTGSPTAREDEKLGHGIFTHYLIEGLEKGYADQNGDGYISIDELYEYVYKKTKENCTQVPKREGRIEGTFLIGVNPQKIEANKYELRKKKLIREFVNLLPPDVYQKSLNILIKGYEDPSTLEQNDITILRLLESLLCIDPLSEKGSNDIRNYIETVQYLKEKKPIENQLHEEFRTREEEEKAKWKREEQDNLQRYNRKTKIPEENKKGNQEEIEKIKNTLINVCILYAPVILLIMGGSLNISENIFFISLFLLSLAPFIHLIVRFIQRFIQFLKYKRENEKETQEEIEKIKNASISMGIICLPIILLLVGVLLKINNGIFILLFFLSFSMSVYFIIRSALRYVQLLNDKREVDRLEYFS
jgi:hypothetical protein